MNCKLILAILLFSAKCYSQELYVFTEPASNMATKSIGVRLNNAFMKENNSSFVNYHFIPEVMFGISKNVMLHGDIFFSNSSKKISYEGGSVYAKYRFYSNDDIQTHFRLAAFGRVSYNNSDVHQEEINLYGHNSGWETGIVATQLLHKVALSSGISYSKAMDNGNGNKFIYGDKNSHAINYTLSFGKLMLPKEYKDYKQTNLNVMAELLSQYNPGSKKYYIDVAPSVQLIFNSQARLDAGYRKQLSSTLLRTASSSFFIRLEYNFFNAW